MKKALAHTHKNHMHSYQTEHVCGNGELTGQVDIARVDGVAWAKPMAKKWQKQQHIGMRSVRTQNTLECLQSNNESHILVYDVEVFRV